MCCPVVKPSSPHNPHGSILCPLSFAIKYGHVVSSEQETPDQEHSTARPFYNFTQPGAIMNNATEGTVFT